MAAMNPESGGMAVPLNPPPEVLAQDFNRHHERRDAAQARALTPGWKTSEFWLTVMVAIGAISAPLLTLQTMIEQLAAIAPQYKALTIIGTIIGGLAVAAKAIGDYGKARSAVKTGIRMMALALALSLMLTSTSAMAREWTPVTAELPATLAPADSSLLDSLSLGVSAGWSFERKAFAVDLVGVAHLAEAVGWTFSVGFSGELLQAMRDLAAGSFEMGTLSGGVGFYALLPARQGAPLRVALGVLLEGSLAGKTGAGIRFVLFR